MIRFFKNRSSYKEPQRDLALGQLELSVMEIVWSLPEASVHDVVASLDRDLAYTTVMTTLARLFQKGLLNRRKSDRAFVYSACISHQEWQRRRASALVTNFLSAPDRSPDLLLSCLLEAVGQHDARLLNDLEKKIRRKRKELSQKDPQ